MAVGQTTGITGIQPSIINVQNPMRLLLVFIRIMTIIEKTGDGNSDVLNC